MDREACRLRQVTQVAQEYCQTHSPLRKNLACRRGHTFNIPHAAHFVLKHESAAPIDPSTCIDPSPNDPMAGRKSVKMKNEWHPTHLSGTKSFALVKASSDRHGCESSTENAVPASNSAPLCSVMASLKMCGIAGRHQRLHGHWQAQLLVSKSRKLGPSESWLPKASEFNSTGRSTCTTYRVVEVQHGYHRPQPEHLREHRGTKHELGSLLSGRCHAIAGGTQTFFQIEGKCTCNSVSVRAGGYRAFLSTRVMYLVHSNLAFGHERVDAYRLGAGEELPSANARSSRADQTNPIVTEQAGV